MKGASQPCCMIARNGGETVLFLSELVSNFGTEPQKCVCAGRGKFEREAWSLITAHGSNWWLVQVAAENMSCR